MLTLAPTIVDGFDPLAIGATPTDTERHNADAAVRKVLNSNTKLEKTPRGESIAVRGVTLAPAKRSGIANVCNHATAACIAACCLWFSGRTVSADVRNAARNRTILLALWPERFARRLFAEVVAAATLAAVDGARFFLRLNTASDVRWPIDFIASLPATVYDYTKDTEKAHAYARGELPANYHVSLSVHESTRFADVATMIDNGGNVVVVVDSVYRANGRHQRFGVLPARIVFTDGNGNRRTVETVDGDVSDVRVPEFDGRGVAVCLRNKGTNAAKAAAVSAGFARPFSLGTLDHATTDGTLPPCRGTAVVRLA